MNENFENSITQFDLIIANDSAYIEPYLYRGFSYLMIGDTIRYLNLGIENLNVSGKFEIINNSEKAINDFQKCIDLKNSKYKKFPDSTFENYILRFVYDTLPEGPVQLGARYIPYHIKSLFNGVRIFLSDVDKDRQRACLLLEDSKKYYNTEKLIKKNCK